ncbi:MAG: SAM-dependent methyltransferase [Nitrospirae bacterium]|nr:SAM-dependent methyltransferase [Nitrospirota bacterium]
MEDDSSPELVKLIVEEIRKKGSISFRDFMAMSLYDPGLGYYASYREKIGREGDYYTAPHLTPVFGAMIGKQILEMRSLLGDEGFIIVEMGGGKGLLSSDILDFLKREDNTFYDRVQYHVIEISPGLKEKEFGTLNGNRVIWHNNLDDLQPGIKGVFISNELVDSFPVHQVIMEDNRLREVFVDWVDGRFVEVIKDPSTDTLEYYFKEMGIDFTEGYRTEANLDALKWLERVGGFLDKGFVITIDYGYLSDELYQSYRSRGTLLCYYRHTTCEDPYTRIGYQDITSHVNFSALIHWGKKKGLEFTGFTNQTNFLINIGVEDYIRDIAKESTDYRDYMKRMLPIKNLLMPAMGETFKVLIQHKGLESPSLKGLTSP